MKGTGDGRETKQAAIMIIVVVGAYALISLIGSFAIFLYLASKTVAIPTEQVPMLMALSATGGSAVTGLLGLLGRTSVDPTHTTIDNTDAAPIPTTEVKPSNPTESQ